MLSIQEIQVKHLIRLKPETIEKGDKNTAKKTSKED
jgi:hypothetical protein